MRNNQTRYVDGFVIVVPKKNVPQYRKMAKFGKELWMKHGALDYKECVGDDLKPKGPDGRSMPMTFPKMVKAKPTESVWFSFIVFKSKKHRDQVNKKVMNDPAMKDPKLREMPMPFDMKRFAYGGFKVVIDSEK